MQGSREVLSTCLHSTWSSWGREAAPEAKGSEQVQSRCSRRGDGRGRGRKSADPGA